MSKTVKPSIADVSLAELEALLERVKPVLSREDYECVATLVQTLIELTRQVQQKGTTIARLRRLFGLRSSEKTGDVLGDGSTAQAQGKDAAQDGGGSCDDDASTPCDAPDGSELEPCASDGDGHDGGDDDGASDDGHGKKRRKGHGRIPASAYEDAQHIAVAHESLHAGDTCPDCVHGKLYPLRQPARILRIVGQAPLAAICWDCEQLRCGGCGEVFTARAPDEAQGPKYSESGASMMALLRYGAGMPLNRLDRLQRNLQTPVPSSTQWEVVRDREPGLRPVYDELVRQAADGSVLHNDDTYVRILELMGKRRAALLAEGKLPDPDRTGLFTTGVVAVTGAGPIALFFTGRKHAGENLAKLLDKRDPDLPPPMQMCDGLDRNLPKDHPTVVGNCLSHGRRHIVDEVDNFPDECRHVLEELGKVFKNDAFCRKQQLTGPQRLQFHQRESGPVMTELEKWLRAQLDDKRVEPNSGLGEAFNYLLKRWDKLTLFLRVPGAPLENNIVERALKMAIRHRNNSLFYRSERGAEVGDLYMALIYTAELHGENPFEYLIALLRHEQAVADDPAAWLPWTYRATLAVLEDPRARAA